MSKDLNEVLNALCAADYNIFDANLGFEEYHEEVFTYSPSVDVADIDSFDCVSIPTTIQSNHTSTNHPDWAKLVKEVETGETYFWDQYDDFIMADLLDKQQYDTASAAVQENIVPGKSLEEVLAEFDSWAGTPVDILSYYGDFDLGNNIFEGDFHMDVPVKIYSRDEEVVVKASFPWIKANSFENIYPDELNLKSVLSILPVRVNSQEVKASFVNGEFKLEFPKEQKKVPTEEKNAL